MNKEIEAKFYPVDKDQIRNKLRSIGARLEHPEVLMKMAMFDFKDKEEMNETGLYRWFRVRDEGDRVTLNVKEFNTTTKDKHVKELEFIVGDFEKSCELLSLTGLEQTSSQEKYREKWLKDSCEITIDTWPGLEPFIEIEGASEELVKSVSEKLELNYDEAIWGSVDPIYEMIYGIPEASIREVPELTFEKFDESIKKLQQKTT